MNIIWVLDNIKGDKSFYSKLHILILIASVRLWKKFYSNDNCILYCDELTRDTLSTIEVLQLWDKIEIYKPSKKVNKEIFWAAAKLEVLALQKEPCILVDNDMHIYSPIKDYLDPNKFYVHNIEEGKGYYPSYIDPHVRKLSLKPRWPIESVNVAFLQLPDVNFIKEYAEGSLKLMEEFTAMNVPNSQYLIFAEQLFLSYLFKKRNIQFKSLVGTFWNCNDWEWGEDHDRGIWPIYESEIYFKHYGPLKSWILQNKADQNYEREIKHLLNCINIPNLDITSIKKP